MNFKTFSLNEYYYNDFSPIRDKDRSSKIGRRLEAARTSVRDSIRSQNQEKDMDSARFFVKKTLAGALGFAAATADLFGSKKDKDSRAKKNPQKDFEGWREDLGPSTTEKDLDKFAEKSEKVAVKRYGKDWSYDSPKTEDQKKFADYIKKGENEIIKRMGRK